MVSCDLEHDQSGLAHVRRLHASISHGKEAGLDACRNDDVFKLIQFVQLNDSLCHEQGYKSQYGVGLALDGNGSVLLDWAIEHRGVAARESTAPQRAVRLKRCRKIFDRQTISRRKKRGAETTFGPTRNVFRTPIPAGDGLIDRLFRILQDALALDRAVKSDEVGRREPSWIDAHSRPVTSNSMQAVSTLTVSDEID